MPFWMKNSQFSPYPQYFSRFTVVCTVAVPTVGTIRIYELIYLIRSEYGYGPKGSPPKIPGGATLVFDVELFDFQGDDISKDKVRKGPQI